MENTNGARKLKTRFMPCKTAGLPGARLQESPLFWHTIKLLGTLERLVPLFKVSTVQFLAGRGKSCGQEESCNREQS